MYMYEALNNQYSSLEYSINRGNIRYQRDLQLYSSSPRQTGNTMAKKNGRSKDKQNPTQHRILKTNHTNNQSSETNVLTYQM